MNVGFLITGRLKSTRLPRKLLLKINEVEVISWMIKRIKISKSINDIVICTSVNAEDDPLEIIADKEGVKCFRGAEDDVIERLYEASVKYKFDYVINITADCPLVSWEYIEKVVEVYQQEKADLIRTLDLPHGLFIYGLKVDALKKIVALKKEKNTEVWGKLFTDSGLFKVNDVAIPKELIRPEYRLTLDYPEDYQFFIRFFKDNGEETYKMTDKQIVNYLDSNPEVVQINAHCEALYKQRWNKQGDIKL